ncbi:MAG: hypothetical protein IK058_01000 [Bacteroidales bacterium]|nr:hypothetical protein [Bacteroidales bacterium]
MDWKGYELQCIDSYYGEDSEGNDTSGSSVRSIDRLSSTREITLSPAHAAWSHSLDGGRYTHTYGLLLVKKG